MGQSLNTAPSATINGPAPSVTGQQASGKSPNILTGLLNLEFSNYHLSSRGVNLQDHGLVTQPKLLLYWKLYGPRDPDADINEITLTTGVWNDVDTDQSGVHPSNWNEIDPSAGINVTFLKDWIFESPFTAFMSESHSYPTTWNWDPRLTYHDHFIRDFSFNPALLKPFPEIRV
jgi:hypothetical protein